MFENNSHEWLAYSYKSIIGCETGGPPSGELPTDDLNYLVANLLVYWSLEHSGQIISPEQSNQLLFQRLTNALKQRELYDICLAFDANDVEYRLLKGHCMWLHLYSGREEIRPIRDSDILVHPNAFEQAASCLEALGYRSDSTREKRISSKTTNQFTFYQWFGQFVNYIDLHRFPHNWPLHHHLGELALQPCHHHKIRSFSTLDKPLAFVWIACHRAKDRFNSDLREVLDAKILMHSMSRPEISQTLELIKTLQLEYFSMLLILQTQRWFGDSLATSTESHVLSTLTQAQPELAHRARKRIAKTSFARQATSTDSNSTLTEPLELFNQYIESLLTPGHRFDALRSMYHYFIAKIR